MAVLGFTLPPDSGEKLSLGNVIIFDFPFFFRILYIFYYTYNSLDYTSISYTHLIVSYVNTVVHIHSKQTIHPTKYLSYNANENARKGRDAAFDGNLYSTVGLEQHFVAKIKAELRENVGASVCRG